MERKALQIELKADQPGALSAVFSTLGTMESGPIDHDGDVTLPGAFEDGADTRLLPAHDWSHYMIGKGTIRTNGNKAIFEGQLNLQTTAGRDWYESMKFDTEHGKALQEFSYGYDVLDASYGQIDGRDVRFLKRLVVHEVSPVTLGAGVGTRTLTIKALKDGTLSVPELLAYLDEHPDEAAALIVEAREKAAVWLEGKADPPADDPDQKFADHAEHVRADVQAFLVRAQDLASKRAEEDRQIGAESRQRIAALADVLEPMVVSLRSVLDVEPPPAEDPRTDEEKAAAALLAKYQTADTFYLDLARGVRKRISGYADY